MNGAEAAELARIRPMSPPPLSARAVFVTDTTSGTTLFALNADEPLPPASLTKVVAALVVLDQMNLDDIIEIQEADRVSPEESQVGLVARDRVSTRDLLRGMLIPSGNDATLALARHFGEMKLGSSASASAAVDAFVDAMNAKAQELGATASHFENPTGIDAENHAMSARDVATVTTIALQNPLFAEIVSTRTATLASSVRNDGYPVTTTNQLLVEGAVTGGKTGSTPRAGGCLVSTFSVGPNQLVAVVLGSESQETTEGQQDYSARFADMRQLIAATSTDYTWIDPATSGTVSGLVDELSVWNASLQGDSLLPVPSAAISRLRYRLVLTPPAPTTNPVGEIQFFVDDELLSSRPAIQAS